VVFGAGAVTRLHPEWWGTDYTALQAALTASAGKTLAITANYTGITSAVIVPANTTVEGVETPQPSIATTNNVVLNSGVVLKNLAITLSGATTSGLYALSVTGLEINNCTLIGTSAQQGLIWLESSSGVKVLDCDLSGGADLIWVKYTSNSEFIGNFLHHNTINGNFHEGIHLWTDISHPMTNIRIIKNHFKNISRSAVTVWGGDSAAYTTANQVRQITNVIFTDNIIDTCGQAGFWTSMCEDVTVSNNQFKDVVWESIDFEGSKNCVATGNVLKNCSAVAGGFTCFFGSQDITFSNNQAYQEGNEDVITDPGHNAKTTAIFAVFRDDCNNIKFVDNILTSKTAGGYCSEISLWKGGTANHSSRGPQDVTISDNILTNVAIVALQGVDNLHIKSNIIIDEVDITKLIYGNSTNYISIYNNSIRSVTGSALSGSTKSPIYVSNESQATQRITHAVIEGNKIYGYNDTGITVYTAVNPPSNPDGGLYCIRNNKVSKIYKQSTATSALVELNYHPDTYAASAVTTY
jgi:hypothetical protein